MIRIRLKSEVDVSSPSLRRITENNTRINWNFLESLSERIPLEEKHPAAKRLVHFIVDLMIESFVFAFQIFPSIRF